MTNDEKAKAYEMALEAARKELGVDRKEWEVVEHVPHNIFPELRGLEDERIRKWLVDYFSSIKKTVWIFRDITCEQILDWLEKQKEQKPCEPKNWPADKDTLTQEQKPVVTHGETYRVDTLGTQQVIAGKMPQKPAEWSEEDDQLIGFIFDLLNDLFWRKDWAMSKEECLERLKSLRPSWKPSEEQMEALERASTNEYLSARQFDILVSLYEQLKKLI